MAAFARGGKRAVMRFGQRFGNGQTETARPVLGGAVPPARMERRCVPSLRPRCQLRYRAHRQLPVLTKMAGRSSSEKR